MLKKLVQVLLPLAMLAACDVPTVSGPAPQTTAQNVRAASFDELRNSDQAERAFVQVVQRLEPVAERECRNRTTGVNCDFRIVVDDRPNQPANAYQTLDKSNRPVIFFTLKLIQEAYNADEIAFVMGHESAHHIAGHIARQRQNAVAGAVIFAGLATLTGGDAGAVESAQRLGEQVGARSYSKEFELEADALGIPGEAATAVLLGGLMIQGVTPGPMLFESQSGIIYGIFLAYLVANFFMLIIMCLGIKLFVRVLLVPRKQLISAIIVFCFIGVYGVDGDVFNLYIMLAFGLLGYFLNRYGFGTAPVILGLILGPIAESNLRRGLQTFGGDWTPFFTRPISVTFLVIACGLLALTLWQNYRTRQQDAAPDAA